EIESMKNVLKSLAVAAVLTSMVGAYAQKTKTKAPAAKTMTCPSCKMPMAMKPSKAAPVAVKTKNGTFYCCAGCESGKAAAKAAAKAAP
ncbi:hypothetical protein, partial [Salmonella enterica]|uniref:hypothetical protein n=1 Tax=Salmonella enterica TaxID=28901 RepID=UPI0032B625E3